MKTLKTSILCLGIMVVLLSCDAKKNERAELQRKVDSLQMVVELSSKTQQTLDEVGVMIDSIDANRKELHTKMVEGTSYADYVTRLKNINTYIQNSEKKLEDLTKSLKSTKNSSAAAIKRLKNDLELRSQEIVALQIDIANAREENKTLMVNITRKDSVITGKDNLIKAKEVDITSLQGLVKDVTEQNKIKVANLYYAQAQALETAAVRTKFAPRKKKETKREALELYKLSLSLGKAEAQEKIDTLEKELG